MISESKLLSYDHDLITLFLDFGSAYYVFDRITMIQWVSYKMYLWWTRELVSQRPTALIFTDCNPSLVLQTTGGRCCTLRLTCLEWLNIRLTWTIAVFQPETFLCSTMELIISNQLHLVPQIVSFSPTSSPFLGQTWTTSKKKLQ